MPTTSADAALAPQSPSAINEPPAIMPASTASEVPISTRPLPPTSSSFFSACGRIAYLIGPNIVECRPIRNSTTNSSQTWCAWKAYTASSMAAISSSLM